MSSIIRSEDNANLFVRDIQLDERATHAVDPDRPKGGIRWIDGARQVSARHVSQYEQYRQETDMLLANARAEAEKIQQRAYHEGFAQGEAAGRKLAMQKIEPVLRALNTLLESLSEERKRVIEQYESDLIKLAFSIALRLIHREIELSQDVIVGIAAAALTKVVKANKVKILVSPFDLEILQQHVAEGDVDGEWLPSNLKVESDFNITRGGCRVLTDSGEIDATIESQIHQLKTILWND